MNPKNKISVVIPVYRSVGSLPELHARLDKVMKSLSRDYEIIFVEDGGGDGSWEVLRELAKKDPCVQARRLSRNFGQHNAILCGIRQARYDLVVTMDDDLQHPPEEIPKLLKELNEDTDVVYGVPENEQHGFFRDAASTATKAALGKFMGAQAARNVSAFRVFRTRLREAFRDFHGSFVSIDVLLSWGTTRFGAVRVRHEPRSKGRSNYTLPRLLSHTFTVISGFSTWPLKLVSAVGFLFALFGVFVLVFVLWRYLTVGTSVQGFPFLASIIAIFSGAQLFALGLLGGYLSRMHMRMMEKPAYVVLDEDRDAPPLR